MKPFPTNEIPQRIAEVEEVKCTRYCEICGVAVCKTKAHQPWICRCGHLRMAHIRKLTMLQAVAIHWSEYVPPTQEHPHPCGVEGCPCKRLTFLTLGDIQDGLTRIEDRWKDS